MTDLSSNIGPRSTRRRVATAIAVIGVVFIANRLHDVWPRDVDVSYQVGPGITELDVDYLEGDEAVASVRFNARAQKSRLFQHTVRLQPGEYQVHVTLHGQYGSPIEEVHMLAAPAPGLVRFDLRRAKATE